MLKFLQPEGWARPLGYANGVSARGRLVFIAGQIGWNAAAQFETDDLVDQTHQALRNIAAVLACDGGLPEHITNMTWYFLDTAEYVARGPEIGRAYRAVMGRHFPAMTAVEVSRLVEARARVEIQATAVIPD